MKFDEIIERVGTSSLKWDSDERYQNKTVLPLWVADTDFSAPSEVVEALEKRAGHPIYGYTYDNGDFNRILKDWVGKRHQWDIEEEWINYSPSVLTSLGLTIQAVTKENDEIVIMQPVYYPFAEFIENNGRKIRVCRVLEQDDSYEIDFDGLEACLKEESVKLLILCNPHNPVGRVYRKEELLKIGELCLTYHVKIFSDEIHADLTMPGYKHIPIASLSRELENITVTAYSPSKIFNLAGLQASGAVIANKEIRDAFLKKRAAVGLSNINCFAYEGFKTAFACGEAYVSEVVPYLKANYDYMSEYIKENIPEIKVYRLEATYLAWLGCRDLGFTSEELDKFFMEKAGISLDSGHWFGEGGDQFMRINIGCPRKTLTCVLERLKTAVEKRREEL